MKNAMLINPLRNYRTNFCVPFVFSLMARPAKPAKCAPRLKPTKCNLRHFRPAFAAFRICSANSYDNCNTKWNIEYAGRWISISNSLSSYSEWQIRNNRLDGMLTNPTPKYCGHDAWDMHSRWSQHFRQTIHSNRSSTTQLVSCYRSQDGPAHLSEDVICMVAVPTSYRWQMNQSIVNYYSERVHCS